MCQNKGMYLKVRARVKAGDEKIICKSDDHYEIWVKEPAERNLANIRIRQILAQELKVPEGTVRLISGHHSPSKIFSIKT